MHDSTAASNSSYKTYSGCRTNSHCSDSYCGAAAAVLASTDSSSTTDNTNVGSASNTEYLHQD
jgi:hypothetical protein